MEAGVSGSFQTVNGHWRTTGSPYRAIRCLTNASTRSSQASLSFGGLLIMVVLNILRSGASARASGIKPSWISGLSPMERRKSRALST